MPINIFTVFRSCDLTGIETQDQNIRFKPRIQAASQKLTVAIDLGEKKYYGSQNIFQKDESK